MLRDAEFVRTWEEATDLARGGDPRVAIALALLSSDPAVKADALREFSGYDRERVAAVELAALTLVYLYARGYRAGWDGVKAAALVYMADRAYLVSYWTAGQLSLAMQEGVSVLLGRRLIAEGDAAPEPGRGLM
jgi:hypothetical protein